MASPIVIPLLNFLYLFTQLIIFLLFFYLGYRSLTWKILLSYVPPSVSFVSLALQRKRTEYLNLVNLFFPSDSYAHFEEAQLKILKIIQADVPRTQPELKVFHLKEVEKLMVRVLFTWNLKHPASGYVQGK
jgi:TBC1 domain family member 2